MIPKITEPITKFLLLANNIPYRTDTTPKIKSTHPHVEETAVGAVGVGTGGESGEPGLHPPAATFFLHSAKDKPLSFGSGSQPPSLLHLYLTIDGGSGLFELTQYPSDLHVVQRPFNE